MQVVWIIVPYIDIGTTCVQIPCPLLSDTDRDCKEVTHVCANALQTRCVHLNSTTSNDYGIITGMAVIVIK